MVLIRRLATNLRAAVSFINEFYLRRGPVVIVYQMGKVGSTSIAESLRARGYRVFKIHTMRHSASALTARRLRGWLVFRRYIRRPRGRVPIVTLVRDPVARNLADFFQNLGRYEIDDPERMSVDQLIEAFQAQFSHRVGVDWFERELDRVLDFDVFEHTFDPQRGYAIERDERGWDLLLLQLEIEDETKSQALEELLGERPIPIVRENVSADKDYSGPYQSVVKAFRPAPAYLDELYSSRMATHFYSSEQLQQFRTRWQAEVTS